MNRLAQLPPAGRVVAVVFLTLLMVTLLITLENRARAGAAPEPSAKIAGAPATDLSRCRAMGEAAVGDPTCQAAWAENRARFFGGGARP